MPTLRETIETDAAKRLPLPAHRHPSQELARYKNFLKVEGHRLKILHRGGASGREICQARAAVMNVLLRYLVEAVKPSIEAYKDSTAWGLVAIGGLRGRGIQSPHGNHFMFPHHDGFMCRGPCPSLF